MKLSAAYINSTPYWDELLNQVGVSAKKIIDDRLFDDYPVVIINGPIEEENKTLINNYISNGGSAVTEAGIAKDIFNFSFKRKKIEYLYSPGDDLFPSLFAEINSTVLIPDNANYLQSDDGSNTIFIKKIGKGDIVVLPDKLLPLIFSGLAKRKIFYSRLGKELPTEKVSHTAKDGIYKIIYRILEYLFHKKNLPFIRLWHLPDGNESVFGFRVDTDFANDDEIKDLYNTIKENKIRATWFVETLSRKDNFKVFKEFLNQEIGLHCYRHKSYKDVQSNVNDIRNGLKILNDNGLFPFGYASPFGDWNESLGSAVKEYRFTYSSEFGFIYDALPVHPLVNGRISESIQIPIHPVSTGRLNISGHSDTEMIKYYSDIIDQKRKAYDPIIFYTHPSPKRNSVFKGVFNFINDYNISSLTFNDYAEWWEKRGTINWNPEITENKITANAKVKYDSVFIHLSFSNGKNYLTPIGSQDLLSGKEIKKLQLDLLPGFNPDLVKKNSFKILKQDIIYNYRKLKH